MFYCFITTFSFHCDCGCQLQTAADSGNLAESLGDAPLGRGKTTGSCFLPNRKEYKPAIIISMPNKLQGLSN